VINQTRQREDMWGVSVHPFAVLSCALDGYRGYPLLYTHICWTGSRQGPNFGLDDVEKKKYLTLQGIEAQFLGRPARSAVRAVF